jgi:predicted Zn-dependent protease
MLAKMTVLIAFMTCLLLAGTQAIAAEQYYVNNKPVDTNTYQAAMLVKDALTSMRANQNDDAFQKLSQAVQLSPTLADAHYDLAIVDARLGKVADAIPEMQKAIDLGDNNEGALISLGGFYQSAGQIDLAVNTYNQFVDRYPQSAQVSRIKALVHSLSKENNQVKTASANQVSGGTMDGARPSDDYLSIVTKEGLCWSLADMPINVYIDSGDGVSGFHSEFSDILRQAFADWSAATKGRISFAFVDSAKAAQIHCVWTANPGDLDNPSEQGQANTWMKDHHIVKARITFLTIPWSSSLPMGDSFIRLVCLHEIGHTLGLFGHTDNPQDVMFMSISNSQVRRQLSNRDINTICRLYSIN